MRKIFLAAASAAFLFVSSAAVGRTSAAEPLASAPASPELQRGEKPSAEPGSAKAGECIDPNRAIANAKRLNERGTEHVELFADLNSDMSKVFTVKWNASHARFPIRKTPERMMIFVKYREDGRQILLNPVLWVVMFRQGCGFDEGPMSVDEFEKMMDGPSADLPSPAEAGSAKAGGSGPQAGPSADAAGPKAGFARVDGRRILRGWA
jgi:hypothetical protein